MFLSRDLKFRIAEENIAIYDIRKPEVTITNE